MWILFARAIIASTARASSVFLLSLKALANEDTLLRTHCCRHNVTPFAHVRNICCGHKFCVRDTKHVPDFVQKYFVFATNVSQFAQPKKHHGQQCVRNNVSSFSRALIRESSFNTMMTRRRDEDLELGLRKFLDSQKGGSENLYTSKPTGGGAPKKLNR